MRLVARPYLRSMHFAFRRARLTLVALLALHTSPFLLRTTAQRPPAQPNAAEILLSGRTFDGHEARAYGLCTRVLPNDEVLPAALELAHDIADNTAPLSVAYSKKLLWDSWDLTAADVEARETEYHHHLMGAPDAKEGVMAFLERRPPVWDGRVSRDWRA